MAANPKHTVLYFPHYVDHGRKMTFIDQKYEQGYRAWFRLLEELGKADYHVLKIDDKMSMAYLSAICRMDVDEFKNFLDDMVNIVGEFDAELYGHGLLWNEEFIKSIKFIYRKRTLDCPTRAQVCAVYEITTVQKPVSGADNDETGAENQQSKVEYSKEKETKPKVKRFAPPTVSEIDSYFLFGGLSELQASQESTKFWNHYDSNGWKVGGNKIVSWKGAAGGWISRMGNFEAKNTNETDGIPKFPDMNWFNDNKRTPVEWAAAQRKWHEAGFKPVHNGLKKIVNFVKR